MSRVLAIGILLAIGGLCLVPQATVAIERPRMFFSAAKTAQTAPAMPLPGPRPYYGEALGAVYYNWGYFGALYHAQNWQHTGYYGDYHERGFSRGY